jgi:hypothetical protein
MFFKNKIYPEAFVKLIVTSILELKPMTYESYKINNNVFSKEEIEKVNKEYMKICLLASYVYLLADKIYANMDSSKLIHIFLEAIVRSSNDKNLTEEKSKIIFDEAISIHQQFGEYIESCTENQPLDFVMFSFFNKIINEKLEIEIDNKNYKEDLLIEKHGEIAAILKLYLKRIEELIKEIFKQYKPTKAY